MPSPNSPSDSPPNPLLTLDQQLCFPLYAASRLITRLYQPFLEPLGLTYPQYIVMMILWEQAPCSVSAIGARALLNSNTLTPLLKRLAQLGLVSRSRAQEDERVVVIELTAAGRALQQQCSCIPERLFAETGYPPDRALALKELLNELIQSLGAQPA